jgi:hypothetical protein
MTEAKRSAALATICEKIKIALEKPAFDPAIKGMKVKQKMPDLKLFVHPSRGYPSRSAGTQRYSLWVAVDDGLPLGFQTWCGVSAKP